METTWNIIELKRKPDTGLVFEVTYILNFTLNGAYTRYVGSVQLEGSETDPGFIPYENLTEQTVQAWIVDQVGQSTIDEIIARHQQQLEQVIYERENPAFLTGRPWDTPNQ